MRREMKNLALNLPIQDMITTEKSNGDRRYFALKMWMQSNVTIGAITFIIDSIKYLNCLF